MKKLLPVLLSIIALTVHGQDSTTWARYHAIQTRLDSVLDDDQSGRQQVENIRRKYRTGSHRSDSLWKIIVKKDSVNLVKVKAVLDTDGWLGVNAIGQKANLALFLVIQHSDSLTQVTYLPMMREAVKAGHAEASHLALLEDRVLTNQGKPQIYGSQVRTNKKGIYEFFPIEDERNVNKRRAAAGMEPLETYARNFNISYHLPE